MNCTQRLPPVTRELPMNQRSWKFLTAPLFLLLWALLPVAGQQLPKAPNAQVFLLSPTPGYFTEPSVAINPNNPQQVVAVFQDNVHASYSVDAGQTWQAAEGVAPKDYRVSGD